MKDTKACAVKSCCWGKHEIIGTIFIIVATILTILTHNSFGILGMFIVGVMLLRNQHCNCYCHSSCHTETTCDDKTHGKHHNAMEKPAKKIDKPQTKNKK